MQGTGDNSKQAVFGSGGMETAGAPAPFHGTVYGIALYGTPSAAAPVEGGTTAVPSAPVLYIKPRNTFLAHGGVVSLPRTLPRVEVTAMLGMVFGCDSRNVSASEALERVAGFVLTLDITEPGAGLFRPPIREKCRDGFLPIGSSIVSRSAVTDLEDLSVRLEVDGVGISSFALKDSLPQIMRSIEDISSFMTLRAGDVLLAAGTPHQIVVDVGSEVAAVAEHFDRLQCSLAFEDEEAAN